MRSIGLFSAVLLLLLGCAPAGTTPRGGENPPQAREEGAAGFLDVRGHQAIPLRRLATGHFAVDGTADATTLTLIVDTGASHTIVDVARARRFDLPLRREAARASGVGMSDGEVASGVLRNVALGPLRIDSLPVSVIDLGEVNRVLRGLRVEPVDGIMGADMLLRQEAIIDYGAMRLYVRSE